MIHEFKTKDELFKFLRENKRLLTTQKKSVVKFSDPLQMINFKVDSDSGLYLPKSLSDIDLTSFSSLAAKLAINTTNLLDSHDDVHIPGLWSKSIKERKDIYLLKEHRLNFENIISDEVKATAVKMLWSLLGFNYAGETEVLLFETEIEKARNPYMAEQYAKGRVKQHSVGMSYVKLFLCMNSESKWDVEEKENWDKYFPQIVNSTEADEQGYFWAVTEAKVIEGSAVPLGSNFATPVISIEPVVATQSKSIEPPNEALNIEALYKALEHKLMSN